MSKTEKLRSHLKIGAWFYPKKRNGWMLEIHVTNPNQRIYPRHHEESLQFFFLFNIYERKGIKFCTLKNMDQSFPWANNFIY